MKTQQLEKPRKISQNRNESTYRLGDWIVYLSHYRESVYRCGSRKTTSWTSWRADTVSTAPKQPSREGQGGIKAASAALIK